MIHVLGRVSAEDLRMFIGVFAAAGADAQGGHGCLGTTVYAADDDPGQITVLMVWPHRALFEAFRADPSVRETMRSGGMTGPPEFTVLTKVGEFPT